MSDRRRAVIAALGGGLQRYQRSVQAFDDAFGRRLELGAADQRCLDWLADGPKTAGEVARGAGLRPAATTALLDRLERRGLVERLPDAEDRRRVLVRLTPAAERAIGEVYGPLVSEGAAVFEGFSDAELERVGLLLDRITALTEQHRARLG